MPRFPTLIIIVGEWRSRERDQVTAAGCNSARTDEPNGGGGSGEDDIFPLSRTDYQAARTDKRKDDPPDCEDVRPLTFRMMLGVGWRAQIWEVYVRI